MYENGHPGGGGGGHAIRLCRRMFRKGRPLSPGLHFRFHLGAILGAWVGTMLLFGTTVSQKGYLFISIDFSMRDLLGQRVTVPVISAPYRTCVDFRVCLHRKVVPKWGETGGVHLIRTPCNYRLYSRLQQIHQRDPH